MTEVTGGPPAEPGWLRRNRWGLIALVPALAAGLVVPAKNAYDTYQGTPGGRQISTGSGGWVSYGAGRIRLVEVTQAKLKPVFGRPPTVPPGTTPWRAKLLFRAGAEAYLGCKIELEDTRGRRYAANPNELNGARVSYAGCTLDYGATPAPEYETEAYFVMPAGTRPAAVRIIVRVLAPRYARLTVG